MAQDTVTVTIETDEAKDELTVPTELVEVLGEEGDGAANVVGDLALLGLAQQSHGIVHHSPDDVSDDLEDAEELTMELFEERFGQTYAEMTGHGH
jgi:hypothetical protein